MIVFLQSKDINYDGRSRTLFNTLEHHHKVLLFSFYKQSYTFKYNNYIRINSISKLFLLYRTILNSDRVYIADRKCVILAIILCISKNFRKKAIYDMRELYLISEPKSLFSLIGTILENFLIKRVKFIVCANKQRANLVRKIFNVNVSYFENIRKLNVNGSTDDMSLYCSLKCKDITIRKKNLNIISSFGFTTERNCIQFVKMIKDYSNEANLLFVGKIFKKPYEFLKNYCFVNKLNNIHIIDSMDFNKLSSLTMLCNVGIVSYSNKNINNRLCASGKIYEYISLGIPVIVSNNLPLRYLVNLYNIGSVLNCDQNFFKNYLQNIDDYNKSIQNFPLDQLLKQNKDRLMKIFNI